MGSALEPVRLTEHLQARKRDIATAWLHRSATDSRLHPFGRLPQRDLVDNVHALVDYLIQALNEPASCTQQTLIDSAEKYARALWDLNYAPSQAVLEFGHFRAALQEVLADYDDSQVRRETLDHCSLVCDTLLAHTVGCYSDLQRSVRSAQCQAAGEAQEITLAVVGHEMRSALTPVVTWIEVLTRSARSEAPLNVRTFEQACNGLQRATRSLNRLVNDLNDYAALAHGKLTIKLVGVDLRALIGECVESFEPHARNAGIHLFVPPCEHPVMVLADEMRLQQCLLNLLNNSVKFTPPGGQVRIGLQENSEHAVLEVADSGNGMLPAELSRLFEPFQQFENGRQAGGLGLGLAIVRSIVQLHGGKIGACSDGRGCGTNFKIELPRMAT